MITATERIALALERIATAMERGSDETSLCPHALDALKPHGTMGRVTYHCEECGHVMNAEEYGRHRDILRR
jgi:uncharacterized Zn finger protein